MDNCAHLANLVVTTTGCKDIVTGDHFLKFKEDAIVCNIGHFDCEIDTAWLEANCAEKDTVKPQVTGRIDESLLISISLGRPIYSFKWPPYHFARFWSTRQPRMRYWTSFFRHVRLFCKPDSRPDGTLARSKTKIIETNFINYILARIWKVQTRRSLHYAKETWREGCSCSLEWCLCRAYQAVDQPERVPWNSIRRPLQTRTLPILTWCFCSLQI